MKKIIFLSILGIVAVLFTHIVSCNDKNNNDTTSVLLMVDKTDSLKLPVELDKLYSLFKIDLQNPKKMVSGVSIHITNITGVDFSPSYDYVLPAVDYLNMNSVVRKKQIKKFMSNIEQVVKESQATDKHSSVYLPITRELNLLSEKKADQKVAIIYSNLIENSDFLNGYQAYEQPINTIARTLMTQAKLQDLSNITVIFRYQPKNELENIQYRKFLRVYEKILKENKAIVKTEYP